MTESCERCGHSATAHEYRSGPCRQSRYSEQRIEHSGGDGVEVRQDWTYCDCLHLVSAVSQSEDQPPKEQP